MDPKKPSYRYRKCMICGRTNELLFGFPSTGSSEGIKRYSAWFSFAESCGVDTNILKTIHNKYLCSAHFTTDQFFTPKKLSLLRTAVPTIKPDSGINSKESVNEVLTVETPEVEDTSLVELGVRPEELEAKMNPKVRIYIKCVVCGKTNRLLFSFPSRHKTSVGRQRYMQWLSYAVEHGANLEEIYGKKNNYLCSVHFTVDQFQTAKKLALLRTAIPSTTVFEEEDTSNGVESTEKGRQADVSVLGDESHLIELDEVPDERTSDEVDDRTSGEVDDRVSDEDPTEGTSDEVPADRTSDEVPVDRTSDEVDRTSNNIENERSTLSEKIGTSNREAVTTPSAVECPLRKKHVTLDVGGKKHLAPVSFLRRKWVAPVANSPENRQDIVDLLNSLTTEDSTSVQSILPVTNPPEKKQDSTKLDAANVSKRKVPLKRQKIVPEANSGGKKRGSENLSTAKHSTSAESLLKQRIVPVTNSVEKNQNSVNLGTVKISATDSTNKQRVAPVTNSVEKNQNSVNLGTVKISATDSTNKQSVTPVTKSVKKKENSVNLGTLKISTTDSVSKQSILPVINSAEKMQDEVHLGNLLSTEDSYDPQIGMEVTISAKPKLSGVEKGTTKLTTSGNSQQSLSKSGTNITGGTTVRTERTAEDKETSNNAETVTVTPDLPPPCGETSKTTPSDGTAQKIDGFVSKPHVVQVLGTPNFQDPSVIKSVLEKVNLRKQGSVYVVPLKKSKGRPKPLTRNLIERAIQNLPAVDIRLKGKLLSLIRGLSAKPKKIKKNTKHDQLDIPHIPLKSSKKKSAKMCTCKLHCNKYLRKRPVVKVSPVAYAKIDGQTLKGNMEQTFCDDSVFNVENIFTVSTILTNVNDKSQIEQLCQLLIESLFKLKNVNTDGVMSKLVVYFSQGINASGRDATDASKTADVATSSAHNQQTVTTGEQNNQTKQQKDKPAQKHVKVNLNVIHDHSYLSQECQVLFDKPQYLVNLVNIDTYKSSKKKTQILKKPPKKTPKKLLNEITKLRRYILRLKQFLKKKNERIENMNFKIKYLGSTLCSETGVKRIRYPKTETNTEIVTDDRNENLVRETNSDVTLNEKRKRSRKKPKIVLTPDFVLPPFCPLTPNRDFEHEIVTDEHNENFISKKRRKNNSEGTGSEVKEKRKRRRKKSKIMLTPDFVLPPLDPVTPSRGFEHIQISDMNFEDRFDEFCQSLVEECVVDDSLSIF